MLPRPRRSPPFPYTTLFRSHGATHPSFEPIVADGAGVAEGLVRLGAPDSREPLAARGRRLTGIWRSEEHTSELQSPVHLVCRLLLEKKKIELTLGWG